MRMQEKESPDRPSPGAARRMPRTNMEIAEVVGVPIGTVIDQEAQRGLRR